MSKILILFAHPKFERSRVNKALVGKIKENPNVTFHDLYELYPDFNIDIHLEKNLLSEHDVIVWQHPLFWYSSPPILKQWIDLVLEYNWAYGPNGNALAGKQVLSIVTTGGTSKVYCAEGQNNYSINEFLRPFEQTSRLCGMVYLPPYTIMGTYSLSDEELEDHSSRYSDLISLLIEGINVDELNNCFYLNELPKLKKSY